MTAPGKLKIAITSTFHPAVGGMEAIARQLADGFAERGHEVTVITLVPGDVDEDAKFAYRILRRPGPAAMLREMSSQDVVLQMGVMLRSAWAIALTRVPAVISHQSWFERRNGHLRPHEWLKRRFTATRANVVASRALLTEPAGPATLVPNCYDDRLFKDTNPEVRRSELIFVGRLVPDKGVDLLLLALAELKGGKIVPHLTIVGDGLERGMLERMTDELALRSQVTFAGRRPAAEVADILNRHRILVVPSRWEEPFGIVALEGLACGCTVVAADGGGLREVLGPCGRLFPRNDVAGLCEALRRELDPAKGGPDDVTVRRLHLEQYRPAAMVDRYLEVLTRQLRDVVGRSALARRN